MNITTPNTRKVAAALTATALLFAVTWGARPVLAAPPSAPVITTPTQSTSTNPINLVGTAEASTTITVTGGAGDFHATTTMSGDWNVLVSLTPDSVNTLDVVAINDIMEVSATSTVVITHSSTTPPMATSTPIITVTGDNPTTVFSCNGFTDPGATAVDSAGTPITATSTSNVNIGQAGSYTVVYSATDNASHTATTTRGVTVLACSSGSGGGGSSGSGGSSKPPGNSSSGTTGSVVAGTVTGPNFPIVGIPSTGGEVAGIASFQFTIALRVGASGPEVSELQRRLAETGYFRGPITGYFGPLTRNALIRLQAANGLMATGELDGPTIYLLNS